MLLPIRTGSGIFGGVQSFLGETSVNLLVAGSNPAAGDVDDQAVKEVS